MANHVINYSPSGEVSAKFIADKSFVCGIMGPIGSGKTTACIIKAISISARQTKNQHGKRRSRGAIVRNTYPELKTTTIKSWFEWMPQDIGHWQSQGPPTHHIEGQDGLDMEVMFIALDRPDDVRKLLSLELTWAYINEAREIPRAILDALTGRVGRFPPHRDGGCVSPQIILDSNPPDSDHWWYVLAEEQRPEGYSFYRQPGGLSLGAENLKNLPPNYYSRAVSGKSQDWVRVYVHGEYGFVRDGRPVYPEYVDAVHCREFELTKGFGLCVGLDFGLTPAATIGQRRYNGQWLTRHEIVTEDMGVSNFADLLHRFINQHYSGWEVTITGDPAGSARDHDERTAYQILARKGIKARPASTNVWTVRRDSVGNAMTRMIDGQPGYLIHPDCRVLRKAMAGAYGLRRIAVVGEERFRDIPDKNSYSHVAEAQQYMFLGGGEGKITIGINNNAGTRAKFADSDYSFFS